MRILLISIDAKYIHTNNAVRLLQANCDIPMEILEFTIKDSDSDILDAINVNQPDVVGFSTYIWNVEKVVSIVSSLPTPIIVLGGPEVSYDPEYFLSFANVDYVVRGEGEVAFSNLLHHLQRQISVNDIPNLAYKSRNQIHVNPIEEIKDLSHVQPPYYRTQDIPHLPHKIAYIESSRGCPYHCSYCLSSLEKSVRFFPVEDVKKAITYLMNHGVKTIKFLDRTFNANHHTLEILDHIMQHDNHQTVFQFEITGDILQEEIIHYIHDHARPGLFRFEIGIQSIHEQTNRLVDRFQNTAVLFERIALIQSKGIIDLHLDLIAGLPEEDKDSFIDTFNQVFALGAKELQLGFLKMLRGTKIRKEANRFAYTFDASSPYEIESNHVLSPEDIQEIKVVEHMLELYHNKGFFGTQLLTIIKSKPSAYHFFLEIGRWYQTNHYDMHRYQIKDIYQRLMEILNVKEQYLILQDYLKRSTIKPERFYEHSITKDIRNDVLTKLSQQTNIPLHKLYKHSVLLSYQDEIFCAYYQNNQCHTYTIKAPK